MIALAWAMVKAFFADRVAMVLTLLAPVVFFTLLALFYRHLESPDGIHFDVAVVDLADTEDSRAFVAELVNTPMDHIRVQQWAGDSAQAPHALAVIQVQREFSPISPNVVIKAQAHLPGVLDATKQLVQVAAYRLAMGRAPPVQISPEVHGDLLLRGSAAGIALIFVLFSCSSIAARGLGDDAAGLPERLRSLGIRVRQLVLARIATMTFLAWCQLALTFLWAALFFRVHPENVASLVVAAALGGAACAGFVALLAALMGTRNRFAAVAPVAILVISALAGSMIPRALMPDAAARAGGWTFPAWAMDACSAGIAGAWDPRSLALLGAFVLVCAVGAVALRRGALR